MSYWNYRVVQSGIRDEIFHEIHECFYNDNDGLIYMSIDPVAPFGDTTIDLSWDLDKMSLALNKPVLIKGSIKFVEDEE